MIKGITAGTMIDIQGGGSGTYIYGNPSAQGVGNMHYDTSKQQVEVWDGTTWQQLNMAYPTVSLNSSAVSAIDWAMTKMAEDAKLEELSKKHPAIKAAYETLKRAEDQLKTTIILSKDETTTS
jgi:hypothetical protein